MISPSASFSTKAGFSIIELLVVMAISTMLAALAIPAVNTLQSSGNINNISDSLNGVLENARATAMAHNTYVWVGILRVAASDTSNAEHLDKVVVSAVSSVYGEMSDLTSGSVRPIMPPRELKNVSLTQVPSEALSESGRETSGVDDISSSNLSSGSGGASFKQRACGTERAFSQLIQFSPSGEARVKRTASRWIEIGLQPATGNQTNKVVVQINGLTGQMRTFRP